MQTEKGVQRQADKVSRQTDTGMYFARVSQEYRHAVKLRQADKFVEFTENFFEISPLL
jgi:hypothetical protein